MKFNHPYWRRTGFASLAAVALVSQLLGGIVARAAPIPSDGSESAHHYTVSELTGYTKEQLIALVISLQQQNDAALAAARESAEIQEPVHHPRTLEIVGQALGGIGLAILSSRALSHPSSAAFPMNQINGANALTQRVRFPNNGFALSFRGWREMHALRLSRETAFSGIKPLSLSTCTSNQKLFCNVDVTQSTCASIGALQGAVGAATTLWSGTAGTAGTDFTNTKVTPAPLKGGAATPVPNVNSVLTDLAKNSGGLSPTQLAQVQQAAQAALSSGFVALDQNGQLNKTVNGTATTAQYVGIGSNLLFGLANIWVGCGSGSTTTATPSPTPSTGMLRL